MSGAVGTRPGHGGFVGRVRAWVPERARERARLLLAQTMERRQRRSPAVRGAAIVFHAVAPRAGDPELEIDPPLETRRLDAAIGYLARRYALVRAVELPSAARARKAGAPLPIAVTFDDDLPSHHDHAGPVFERHRAVATAFLCGTRSPFWWQLLQIAVDTRAIDPSEVPHVPAHLVDEALARRPGAIRRLAKAIEELAPDGRDDVARVLEDEVPEPPPLLDRDGAATLAAAGWEIGFHTSGHHLLTTLDGDALREALERRPLATHGALPRTLAYPHGKATVREASAARSAGYVAAFTGYASVLTERTDDHLIGRLQPDTATLGRFALRLARALSVA